MSKECKHELGLVRCPNLQDNRPDIQINEKGEYPVFSKSCNICGITIGKSHFSIDQHDLIELEEESKSN